MHAYCLTCVSTMSSCTMKLGLLPLSCFHILYFLPVLLKGHMKIKGVVSSLKDSKYHGVVNRIDILYITELQGHLKASSSLVSTEFDPHFIFRYHTIMPCKLSSPVCNIEMPPKMWDLEHGILGPNVLKYQMV